MSKTATASATPAPGRPKKTKEVSATGETPSGYVRTNGFTPVHFTSVKQLQIAHNIVTFLSEKYKFSYDEAWSSVCRTPFKNKMKRLRNKEKVDNPVRNVRRAINPYGFFTKEHRPQIHKNQPELSFSDIARVIAEQWKALSHKERSKYVKLAEDDKARYHEEIKNAREQLKNATAAVVADDDGDMDDDVPARKARESSGGEESGIRRRKPGAGAGAKKPRKNKVEGDDVAPVVAPPAVADADKKKGKNKKTPTAGAPEVSV